MASGDDLSLDAAIDEAVRRHARQQRAAAGEHPGEEQLVDYQEGRLAEREAEAVRHHLASCRDCADELLELESWDARPPGEPRSVPVPLSTAARRRAFEERAAAAGHEPAAANGEEARRPRILRRRSLPAGLAAALAAACLVLGFWLGGLGPGGISVPSTRPTDHPYISDLVPDGAAPLRSGTDHEIRVPAGMNPLILRLNLGDQTPYEEYRAEISAADGETAWVRRGLARQPAGSFALLIDLDALEPGAYRLRLIGRNGTRESVLAAYSFSLALPPVE